MTRHAIALAAGLALAACDGGQDAPATPETPSGAPAPAASASPTPAADPAQDAADPGLPPPPASPMASAEEKAARSVVLDWARGLELRRWDQAYDAWGADAEARSGRTRSEHAAYWNKFKTITVAVPDGTMEGAAGSLYYQVPTTVVGKRQDGSPYRLEGTLTLRRVNDVPGATPDQLGWHVEKVDLAPA